jgi:hypothetical protein
MDIAVLGTEFIGMRFGRPSLRWTTVSPSVPAPELAADQGDALAGKLVIDATNRMGGAVANSTAGLPNDVCDARALVETSRRATGTPLHQC